MNLKVAILLFTLAVVLPISYTADAIKKNAPSVTEYQKKIFEDEIYQIYEIIGEDEVMPEYNVFRSAFIGFLNLKSQNKLNPRHDKRNLLTIIDFSMSSAEKRFWLINLKTKKVEVYTYVAHGRNTGRIGR